MPFARGKRALAICDRCGFTVKYLSLKRDISDMGKPTGLMVCDDCNDQLNPQGDPKNFSRPAEGIGLRNPRPETNLDEIREVDPYVPPPVR